LQSVAINNAWRIRKDWDFLISPDDFPVERMPGSFDQQQTHITSDDYVPANNQYGGVYYAGGTMAFTAGYWALAALRPTVLAFLGCDMVYPQSGNTHFYGRGQPDPLREDPSLRNLEAKSARLMMHARRQGCSCVRLSSGESRLVFPSVDFDALPDLRAVSDFSGGSVFDDALNKEDRLGYYAPDGRYWKAFDHFDFDEIDEIDRLWLKAAGFQ